MRTNNFSCLTSTTLVLLLLLFPCSSPSLFDPPRSIGDSNNFDNSRALEETLPPSPEAEPPTPGDEDDDDDDEKRDEDDTRASFLFRDLFRSPQSPEPPQEPLSPQLQPEPELTTPLPPKVFDMDGNPVRERRTYYKIMSYDLKDGVGLEQDSILCPLYVAKQPSDAMSPIYGPLELRFHVQLQDNGGIFDLLNPSVDDTVFEGQSVGIEFKRNPGLKCNDRDYPLGWEVRNRTVKTGGGFDFGGHVLDSSNRFRIRRADFVRDEKVYMLQYCPLGDVSCEEIGTRVDLAISTSPLLVVGDAAENSFYVQFQKI